MNGEPAAPRSHARRNRIIAIAAGVVTVIAIVLGFAGDFLGLPWHWMTTGRRAAAARRTGRAGRARTPSALRAGA